MACDDVLMLQFRKPYVSECRAEQNDLWWPVNSGRVPPVPVDMVRGPRMTWTAGWQGGGRRGGECLPGRALERCWGLKGPSQPATWAVPAWAGFRPVTTSYLPRPLALAVRAGEERKASAPRARSPVRVAGGAVGSRCSLLSPPLLPLLLALPLSSRDRRSPLAF